ncbi:nucleotidyl transferase AbiEii/AbiGii toxin family protein [candidate division KSB1 bacterium]|nr:nucleotidyl transferase AbiEii/AbiGii toxin family protein [candidate division KSB1 bacterium]
MTQKVFLNALANGQADVIQELLDLMNSMNLPYCVIGDLAVNAYVEPVVSLDLEVVIAAEPLAEFVHAAESKFTVKRFEHSVSLESAKSALRMQLQIDSRYQSFLANASLKNILGYEMMVAALEDVLQGKVWAALDPLRRKSKRQKDLADILRLVESYPHLRERLPEAIQQLL